MLKSLLSKLPDTFRETLFIRAFGFTQVPLIFYCGPKVMELTPNKIVVKIPLNRRTRNHLKSMYFGTLAVGADVAGGMIAMRVIYDLGNRVNLVFKDFKADFLKRPEGDVHFVCEEGNAIRELVKKAIDSGQRENMSVKVTALCPSKNGTEPVAQFILTLSLKRK